MAPRLAVGQELSAGGTMPSDIKAASMATPVCHDPGLNKQVREALRLVCSDLRTEGQGSAAQNLIVIGFLGGFARGDESHHPEVWFGRYLRQHYRSATNIEVLPNHQGHVAAHDIAALLDTNHDGALTDEEKKQAKIVIYGHSWGASETVELAKELGRMGIPVLLTVQIDIVAKPHQKPTVIPSNVESAINFFQPSGFLHGRPEIVAESPTRTKIIGNIRMTYDDRPVNCGNYPWFPRTFNKPHHEIENDAQVWSRVASLIDSLPSATPN